MQKLISPLSESGQKKTLADLMAELSTPVRKAGEYSVHKDRESRSAWRIFRLSITAGIGARHKERITLMIPIASLGERDERRFSLSTSLSVSLSPYVVLCWLPECLRHSLEKMAKKRCQSVWPKRRRR